MKNVTLVFWISIAICAILVIWGASSPDQLESVTNTLTSTFSTGFGWYYLIIVVFMLGFCVYLIFSPYGRIKLGEEDTKPEFNLPTWFAMLFTAGMGMAMVFWTTAEPISHAFINAPEAEAGTDQAIQDSLQYAFFHWGIHAWAVYAVVALTLAYFKFHRGYPGLISATLVPLFGEKSMRGLPGTLIDSLAVFATVVGVASTLGFGTAQINEGLAFLFNTPNTFFVQVIVLVIATVLFIISAWSGISKGIKYLSNLNMWLAFILLIALFIVGPTLYILDMFTSTTGNYISNFFNMSFRSAPLDEGTRDWIDAWTIFYWAWWISWSPFVGIFIARISKGRSIKEFMLGVLFVPSLVCFIFFTVFGVSALNLEQNGIAEISQYPMETATFAVLQEYPLGFLMSLVTIVVIAVFFITSADSATFVLGMLSSNGSIDPAGIVKISWGVALSLVAAVVMYFGGTQGLQNTLIIAALPFSVVVLLMGGSFFKTVRDERKQSKAKKSKAA
ncbi:BCCT family transporter [Salibacterium aidingense]|uniref:BCCT family transporter n=1 Tax=Salibacterium aidingense TaxID=384933 RepID=UPI00042133F8|nr:BCCT family transporter [Salibacterium aidingense]